MRPPGRRTHRQGSTHRVIAPPGAILTGRSRSGTDRRSRCDGRARTWAVARWRQGGKSPCRRCNRHSSSWHGPCSIASPSKETHPETHPMRRALGILGVLGIGLAAACNNTGGVETPTTGTSLVTMPMLMNMCQKNIAATPAKIADAARHAVRRNASRPRGQSRASRCRRSVSGASDRSEGRAGGDRGCRRLPATDC